MTSRPITSIGWISSMPTTQPDALCTLSEPSQRSRLRNSGTFAPFTPTSNAKGAVFSIAS
jgi:hypothetical protein